MKCPTCKVDVNRNNKYWPFCCEKCQLVDLYNWFNEEYYISELPYKEEKDGKKE